MHLYGNSETISHATTKSVPPGDSTSERMCEILGARIAESLRFAEALRSDILLLRSATHCVQRLSDSESLRLPLLWDLPWHQCYGVFLPELDPSLRLQDESDANRGVTYLRDSHRTERQAARVRHRRRDRNAQSPLFGSQVH